MAKNTALDLALDLFKSKKTVTPAEINKHVGKGNYASKYVLYLKLHGHDISTNKQGRTVVNYTYNGLNKNVDTNMKVSERRARNFLNTNSNKTVVKVAPTKAASAPTKKAKSVKAKPERTTGKKPVMTKKEIKKATAAIMALREKDAKRKVEKELVKPVAASSFTVDPDWDSAENLNVRELGL